MFNHFITSGSGRAFLKCTPDWLLALLLGLFTRLAFAPYGYWWLAWLLLVCVTHMVLFAASGFQSGTRLALWWFALFISSFYWLGYSMCHYGDLPMWLVCILLGILGILFSIPAWIAGWLVWRLARISYKSLTYILFWPLILLGVELVVGSIGECAWLQMAYTQLDGPLVWLSTIIGGHGLSFMMFQYAGLMAYTLKTNQISVSKQPIGKRCIAYFLYSILITSLSWVGFRLQPKPAASNIQGISVTVAQLAVTPDTKWDPVRREEIIQRYWEISNLNSAANCLVVWPEAAVAEVIDLEGAEWKQITKNLAKSHVTLITGCLLISPAGVSNGLVAAGLGYGSYQKQQLLPFGEYLPMRNTWLGNWITQWVPFSDLQKGEHHQPLILINGVDIASVICSEIAHSNLLGLQIPPANLIVGVADDSWFGLDSSAGQQHLAIARLRSIEYGRYQVWVNNSGPSAVIDNYGRVISEIPKGISGAAQAVVYPIYEKTIYSRLRDIRIRVINFIKLLSVN